MENDRKILCLFDVDGTLTPFRMVSKHLFIALLILNLQGISPEMKDFILAIKKKVVIGIVSGSDHDKIQRQMGGDDSKLATTYT